MTTVSIDEVYDRLAPHKELRQHVTFEKALQFIRLASGLKNDILFGQKPSHNPVEVPDLLPTNVHAFICQALQYPDSYISALWEAFKDTIWCCECHPAAQSEEDKKLFYQDEHSQLMTRARLINRGFTCL